jgi:Zn-finger nucleic acid-binding protein
MATTGSSFGGDAGFKSDAAKEGEDPGVDAAESESFVPLSPRRAPTEMMGPSEAINLVPLLAGMVDKKGKDLVKVMSQTVISDYDADVRSRSKRMKKIDKFQKLYASILKAKSFPFQNAATVNLPLLTYPALQTHARLFDMVVPANGKIMLCAPTNLDDVQRASLCEKFGNSYIRYRMDSFATGMDETLLQVVVNGSAFRRTYWNQYDAKVCSDFIPIADFVVAYSQKSVDPSMRDVPRYTMVQHLTIFDLEDYGAQGIYENVEGLKPDDGEENSSRDDGGLKETLQKEDGVEPASESSAEDKPRMVLEQHRKWRMPNNPKVHPSFDGRAHAVIITVDERSQRVLRVVVREEDDPTDLRRYESDMAKFSRHTAELAAHAEALTAQADAAAIAAQQGIDIPQEEPPPPPQPPEGVELDEEGIPLEPKKPRQREIAFFTHYKCFPGEGFYGHGFGDFLAPLAEAANTLLNQHIDGVTLKNARPGFISRQLRGARGSVNVQPGELIEVDAPMGVVKDGIAWLDPPMSDPSTMPLLELLQAMTEKFGGSDIISGEVPKSNNTATGMTILNEQAMAPITVMSRRIKESEKHELDKIWRCWGVFLSDEEIADIIDENGVSQSITVSREMFRPDAHVMPVSDPRMKSTKVQETTQLWTMAMQNPLINQFQPAMQALTEDVLRAMDANKIIPMIQPPPPQPPPPPKPHSEEDANFLRGQDQPVNAGDDDPTHIAGHMAFKGSPAGQLMDKGGHDMLDRHIRMHAAQNLDKKRADMGNILKTMMPPPEEGAPPPEMMA